MVFPTGLPATPEWKQFLQLGEQLLRQPTAADQCRLFLKSLRQVFHGHVDLWLASPFYPLPGQPEVKVLPGADAPALVEQAFVSRQPVLYGQPGQYLAAALPLILQEDLLGVVWVECTQTGCLDDPTLNLLQVLSATAALAFQANRQAAIKHWRFEQLALVRSVSAQIANLIELDELCSRVTRLIQETFNYYYVAIFTLEGSKLRFRAGAAESETPWKPGEISLQPGQGFIGHSGQTGEEVLAKDVRQDERFRYIDALPETQSEFTLPLKVENRILGVLDIQSDQKDAFHEFDQLVLRALADAIALGIEGTRLYDTLERRAEQITAVYEVSRALSSILDLDTLLDEVVEVIHRAFGYPYVHVFTVHSGRRKIFYRAGSGKRADAYCEHRLSYNLDARSGIIPYVARSGKTVLANDVSKEPYYLPSDLPPYETNSELSIPIKFNEEVLAVLDIQSDQPDAFNENDRSVLEALSANIAVAIRNAGLYRSEQWRRQVADSFRDVAGLLSANVAPEELLSRILEALENNLPCEASAIWLIDENHAYPEAGRLLRLAAARGVTPQAILDARERSVVVREWLDRALDADRPTIRRPEDPYGPLGVALDYPPDYSSIACPLRAGGRSLGVLTLSHPTPNRFGSEARDMAATFASYAAVAIQNSRLYMDAQEQAWISTVLLQVAEANRSVTTMEDLLGNTIRLIPLLMGVKRSAAFLWNEDQHNFTLVDSYGMEQLEKGSQFQESDLPALARMRATRSTLFIQNSAEELNLPGLENQDGSGTLVLLPMLSRGEVLGGLLVNHHPGGPAGRESQFTEQMLSILQGIAHQTAVSVENIRLVEVNQEEAYVTAVLLQVAQAVVSLNNLSDILDTIVHLMPILVGIDACIIYLWDGNRQIFLPSQAFSGLREEERALLSRTYGPQEFSLLDSVREHDTFILCPLTGPDLPPDAWPELPCLPPGSMPTPSMSAYGSWLIGVPLTVKGEVYGVMLAKENNEQPGFRDRRLEIMNGVAQELALAIQNDHLAREMVERERMEREVQLAREIQRTFLPEHLPQHAGWEMDARWQTARQVGGDFYDVFRLGEHRLGIVIADVADKGMPAALYMTVTRTLIRASVHNIHSPAKVLERVNNLLVPDAQNGMFVTAVYAVLDLNTGELTYANAGHNRPFLLRKSGLVEQLPKGAMALGVFENIDHENLTLHLDEGDCLLLYTDGVTDTFSEDGSSFGEQRLEAVLRDSSGQSAAQVLDAIEQALNRFRAREPMADDITLLAVRRN